MKCRHVIQLIILASSLYFLSTPTPWLTRIRFTNMTFQNIPIPHLTHPMRQKLLQFLLTAGAPVGMWTCPHQVLAATLTLFQLGGADYARCILMSLQVWKATGAPELVPLNLLNTIFFKTKK